VGEVARDDQLLELLRAPPWTGSPGGIRPS
jgi:hypothetical protein